MYNEFGKPIYNESPLHNLVGENGTDYSSNVAYNPMSDNVSEVVQHPKPIAAVATDSSIIPDWIVCSVSHLIFRKPITLKSGQTFEYSTLESLLRTAKLDNQSTFNCPVTQESLLVSDYEKPQVNINIKKITEEWLSKNPGYDNDTYRHPEYPENIKIKDTPVVAATAANELPIYQRAVQNNQYNNYIASIGVLLVGGLTVGFYYAAIAPCRNILLENLAVGSMSPMTLTYSKTGADDYSSYECGAKPSENVPYGSSIQMWYGKNYEGTTCTFYTTDGIKIQKKGYHVGASGYDANGCTLQISHNGAKCSYKMETVCPTNSTVNSTAAALPMWSKEWLELPTKVSELASVVATIPRGIVSNVARVGLGFFNLPLQKHAHLRNGVMENSNQKLKN